MASPFWFPDPPAPDAVEWPGSPLGLSNVITRTRGWTAVQDKTLDREPAARDALFARATDAFARAAARGEGLTADVIIHGIRVRAHTTSPHLQECRRLQRRASPSTPSRAWRSRRGPSTAAPGTPSSSSTPRTTAS